MALSALCLVGLPGLKGKVSDMGVRGYDSSELRERSLRTALVCDDPSLTVQSGKDEADINVILKRFGVTGMLPQNVRPPTFADFDDVFDFQSAMNAIIEAEKSFMTMPADVRMRFGNNPAEFVKFCSDEANLDEMRKLGLAVPKEDIKAPQA